MQSIVPPAGPRNPNGYTAEEVLRELRWKRGTQYMTFRYELLDAANQKIMDLDNVLSCTIEQNWLADIKRKAKFTVRDTGEIDFLSDRIKPYARLIMPLGGYVEWPQGVFLLSSPNRSADETDTVIREVEAYDTLQVFLDNKVENRYTAYQGSSYTATVTELLTGTPKNVTASASTLPVSMEWEPGTPKLTIINGLLSAINYESLSFDEDGVAIVRPYTAPSSRAEEYTYADNEDSVIIPSVDQEMDLFSIPNKWVLVLSEPDRPPLVSTYTNNDPASPTSVVRRQRTIVDFRTQQEAADQASLDARVARLAFEASQIYEAVEFQTAIMPIHSGNDVYRITYSTLAIDAKYSEHSWTMPLTAGGTMQHRARRVVTI